MAVWSSALNFGAHAVLRYYYRGHLIGVRARDRIIIGSESGLEIRVRLRDGVGLGIQG